MLEPGYSFRNVMVYLFISFLSEPFGVICCFEVDQKYGLFDSSLKLFSPIEQHQSNTLGKNGMDWMQTIKSVAPWRPHILCRSKTAGNGSVVHKGEK